MSKKRDIAIFTIVALAVVTAIVIYAGFPWEQVVFIGVVVLASIGGGLWWEDFKRTSAERECDCNDYPTLESGVMVQCRWAAYAYDLEGDVNALVKAAQAMERSTQDSLPSDLANLTAALAPFDDVRQS